MSNWNWLDFFLFLILFVNTVLGVSRGATKEIISIMCVNVALIFTIKFTVPLSNFLHHSPLIQSVLESSIVQNFMTAIGAGVLTDALLNQLTTALSLAICFVGVYSASEAVLAVTGAVDVFTFPYAAMNRKIGGAVGFTRGYLFNVVVILILMQFLNASVLRDSYFVGLFKNAAGVLNEIIARQQVDRYREIYKDRKNLDEREMLKAVSPNSADVPIR